MQTTPLPNQALPPQGVQQSNPLENQIIQELNLQAVRTRTIELQNNIARIQATFYNQPNLRWTDVLGQFAVVNASMFQLMEDLKSILKHFVVHPSQVNAENSSILPIMLSSKLLPEMEEEENAFKEKSMADLSSLPPNAQIERLQRVVDTVKMTCDRAEKVILDERRVQGIGGRQGPYQTTPTDKTRMAKMEEMEKKLRGAVMHGEGLGLSASQVQKPISLPRYLTKPISFSNPALSPINSIASPSADTMTPLPPGADTPTYQRNLNAQTNTPGSYADSPSIHRITSPQSQPLTSQRTPSSAVPSPKMLSSSPASPAVTLPQQMSSSTPLSVQQAFSPNSMSVLNAGNPNLPQSKLSVLNPHRMNVSSPQQNLQSNIQQQQMFNQQNVNVNGVAQQSHGMMQKQQQQYLQQSMQNQPSQNQSMQNQSIQNQSMQNQSMQQQSMQNQQSIQHQYHPQIQQQMSQASPQSMSNTYQQQTMQKQSPLLQQQQHQQLLQQQQQRAMQQQQVQQQQVQQQQVQQQQQNMQQQQQQQQPSMQQVTAASALLQQRQRVAMQQMQNMQQQGMQQQSMQQQQQQQQQQMLLRRQQLLQQQQQQQQQQQNRQFKR